ncbi:MAG: hypothetical protein ACRDKT_06590 [Actinomycetota bacterium]
MYRRSKMSRWLGIALIGGMLSVAGIAYTNTNTFASEPKAGAGAQSISGYEVSGVHYDLNASDPGNIDSIDFTLDGQPASGATIKYRLSDTGAWSSNCTAVNAASPGTTATVSNCTAPAGSTVADVTNLTVVVAD